MPKANHNKNFLFVLSVFTTIIIGTIIISLLARGYRINIKNGLVLNPSGLLSVTSQPKPASVFINDRLITATDDTINLPPATYDVKITKDGYLAWQKIISVKKEIVSLTDAHLFKSAPSLEPLSLSGAINPQVSPDKSKIVFAVASASASTSNGLYIVELSNTPLGAKNTPKLIIPNSFSINWANALSFQFSPDSNQVLATFANQVYQIDLNNPSKPLYDVTLQLSLIKQSWHEKEDQIIKDRLTLLPQELTPFISTQSALFVQVNQNKDRVLYLSAQDGYLDDALITPPPSKSDQTQQRQIQAGNYYIYDIKQDTNFLIGSLQDINSPFWLPNSNHIAYANNNSLKSTEYDSTNTNTLFTNQFEPSIIAPWFDGSKIVILTNTLTPNQDNLYTVGIR